MLLRGTVACLVAAVLFAACPGTSRADTTADLQTIAGDGSSIAEWYQGDFYAGSGSCSAMCEQLGVDLGGSDSQTPMDSTGVETAGSEADDDVLGLAVDAGDASVLEGVAAAVPEVTAAAAAGYAAYKIGEAIFGSPTVAPSGSSASGFYGPFYPAFAVYYAWGVCPAGASDCSQSTAIDPDTGAAADFFMIGSAGQAPGGTEAAISSQQLEAGQASGSFLASEPEAACAPSYCATDGYLGVPGDGNYDFAYLPYSFTPEPATFAPTGPNAAATVSPQSGTAPTGGQLETILENNPQKFAALIHVMAQAHNQAASQTSTSTETTTTVTSSAANTGASPSPGTATATTPTTAGSTGGGSTVAQPSPSTLTIPAINEGQTTVSYVHELAADGFTSVTTHTLTGDEIDLQVGPNDAVTVDPQAGSSVAPATSVMVQGNPADAPAPGSTGAAPASPTLPGVSVPGVKTPCDVFPFGIPCWGYDQLQALTASPQAPSFSMAVPSELGGGSWTVDLGNMFGFNFDSVMGVVRPILLAASCLGVFVWLAGMAMGGSTSAGGDGDE